MKKIGLVGGISWSSTLDYYQIINEAVNEKLGDLNYAECIIYSVNFADFHRANAAHNWDETFKILSNAAMHLKNAGAEVIMLGANTAHIVADRVRDSVRLPLVDIRTATAQAIQSENIHVVGLLGTTYTMELDFYKNKLLEYQIQPMIPADLADRRFIEHTLLHELGKGIFKKATKQKFIRIAEDLVHRGARGIVLGCTEIPLIINQSDISVPVFDTTRIHAQAAVQFALN